MLLLRAVLTQLIDVALKDYDQKLVVGASNHLLHEGDVVTGYRFALSTAFPATAGLASGTLLTSSDAESTARFESFYLPAFTEIDVRVRAIRAITLESVSGTFSVGETVVKGSGGNTATATIYAVSQGSVYNCLCWSFYPCMEVDQSLPMVIH